jgi:NAD kinase
MTREKIAEIYSLASNGTIRPELAAILLSEVCEVALELFKTVEQQNVRIEIYKRAQPKTYVP